MILPTFVILGCLLSGLSSAQDEPVEQDTCCCSEGAYGRFSNDGYTSMGDVDEYLGMNFYRTGNSSMCIIWNYDIFGFNSGRTNELADNVAKEGFQVIIPDYYRGEFKDIADPNPPTVQNFLKNHTRWDKLQKDVDDIVFPYAESNCCTTYGTVGTCWGSYMTIRLSAYPQVKAGVSLHPAHSSIMLLVDENEREIYETMKETPQLIMPTNNDSPNVMDNGLASQILCDAKIVSFLEQEHGFSTRGSFDVENLRNDLNTAFNEMIKLFKRYVV